MEGRCGAAVANGSTAPLYTVWPSAVNRCNVIHDISSDKAQQRPIGAASYPNNHQDFEYFRVLQVGEMCAAPSEQHAAFESCFYHCRPEP